MRVCRLRLHQLGQTVFELLWVLSQRDGRPIQDGPGHCHGTCVSQISPEGTDYEVLWSHQAVQHHCCHQRVQVNVCCGAFFFRCLNAKSPELCGRFERKLKQMTDDGVDPTLLEPQVAYHGSREENVSKIVETGFLLSKLSTNTGNRGAYGAGWQICCLLRKLLNFGFLGIYCSPNAGICIGYCRGGKKIIVCAVLMGRRNQCKTVCVGVELAKGQLCCGGGPFVLTLGFQDLIRTQIPQDSRNGFSLTKLRFCRALLQRYREQK